MIKMIKVIIIMQMIIIKIIFDKIGCYNNKENMVKILYKRV